MLMTMSKSYVLSAMRMSAGMGVVVRVVYSLHTAADSRKARRRRKQGKRTHG